MCRLCGRYHLLIVLIKLWLEDFILGDEDGIVSICDILLSAQRV